MYNNGSLGFFPSIYLCISPQVLSWGMRVSQKLIFTNRGSVPGISKMYPILFNILSHSCDCEHLIYISLVAEPVEHVRRPYKESSYFLTEDSIAFCIHQ